MGNRAVIALKKSYVGGKLNENDLGVYLHWNGGRDSIEPFLDYCKIKEFRTPDKDNYGWARLCQIIANFFGGDGLSIGVDTLSRLDCDNWDNGVYLIEGWQIVGRLYFDGEEQDFYDHTEMLKDIDKSQPKDMQLGKEFFDAIPIQYHDLKIGDKVIYTDSYGNAGQGEVEQYQNEFAVRPVDMSDELPTFYVYLNRVKNLRKLANQN